MPEHRPRTSRTKVTAEEYATSRALAQGQTLSAWVREVLLATAIAAPDRSGAAGGSARAPHDSAQPPVCRARAASRRPTSAMKRLIERADDEKRRRAHEQLTRGGPWGPVMRQTWGRAETAGHVAASATRVDDGRAASLALLTARRRRSVRVPPQLDAAPAVVSRRRTSGVRSSRVSGSRARASIGCSRSSIARAVDWLWTTRSTPAPSRAGMPLPTDRCGGARGRSRGSSGRTRVSDIRPLHAFLHHWIYRDQPLTDSGARPRVEWGVACSPCGPADRDPDGPGPGAGTPPRPPIERSRTRHGAPVQSSVAGGRRRLPADARRVGAPAGSACRARSNRVTSSSWATPGPGSPPSFGRSSRSSRPAARPRSSTIPRWNTPASSTRPTAATSSSIRSMRAVPIWSPGDEWRHEAETLTLATSLFPDRHHENTFFTEAPRRIFAHLLTLRPTPEELACWLCHEEELDRRLSGTAYAAMIDRQAPAQRSGVLASLNMVADTLQLLPAERDDHAPLERRGVGRPAARAGSFSPARRKRARASCR